MVLLLAFVLSFSIFACFSLAKKLSRCAHRAVNVPGARLEKNHRNKSKEELQLALNFCTGKHKISVPQHKEKHSEKENKKTIAKTL